MRRIERLINLIAALLDTRHPMTAEEIRDSIAGYNQQSHDAFRRAFERDKDSLRQMGIPLELVPTDPFSEVPDGYIIPKDKYYLPDLELDPDEAAALRLAAEIVLGGSRETAAGRLKLDLDSSPATFNNPGLAWSADFAAMGPVLGVAYSALIQRRPLRFDYTSPRDGKVAERTIDPYGISHGRGHWYLVGRDHERNDVRSFRIDRIEGTPKNLDGSYEIPEGFDPADYVRAPWEFGDDKQAIATVRFGSTWRWWVEQNLADASRSDGPEGAVDVEMAVANLDRFVSWVIAFGEAVEVLSPPEARAALLARLAPHLAS